MSEIDQEYLDLIWARAGDVAHALALAGAFDLPEPLMALYEYPAPSGR